jgi:CubicO group peptidase (beta-lactamase class C family)
VVGLAGLLLAGCGSDDNARSSSSSTQIPTTSPAPATSPAPSTTGEPEPSTTQPTVVETSTTEAPTEPVDEQAAAATRALFADITPDSPGCSVAVTRNGKVIFAEAYGADELNPTVPMTTDSTLDIGSASKQFTATAIQLLVDRGLVTWDAPLSTYFPELPDWADRITVRQIVTHTSGIPDYVEGLLNDGVVFEDVVVPQQALDFITTVESLDFAPGEMWVYSNSNYLLMGFIVERTSGQPFATFVDREIIGPSGMTAQWDVGDSVEPDAHPYVRSSESEPWVELDWPWVQRGEGGLVTTPSDLALWGSQYITPTIGSADINDLRFVEAAAVPADLAGIPARYGLGLFELDIEGLGRIVGHSGSWESYVTWFAVATDLDLAMASTCTNETASAAISDQTPYDILRIWNGSPA